MRRMTRSIALAILKRTTSGTSPPKGTRKQLRPSIIHLKPVCTKVRQSEGTLKIST